MMVRTNQGALEDDSRALRGVSGMRGHPFLLGALAFAANIDHAGLALVRHHIKDRFRMDETPHAGQRIFARRRNGAVGIGKFLRAHELMVDFAEFPRFPAKVANLTGLATAENRYPKNKRKYQRAHIIFLSSIACDMATAVTARRRSHNLSVAKTFQPASSNDKAFAKRLSSPNLLNFAFLALVQ